ncbi:hypothetical protein Tco_1022677 [Tanacetum coccineum]
MTSKAQQIELDNALVALENHRVIGAEPLKSKKPKTKSDLAISSEEIPSKKKPTKAKKDVPSKKKSASKPKPTKKKALVEADKDVPKSLSESENELWGDSDDDESNEDNSDEVTKDDDVKKEEKEEDDVRTPDSFEFNDDDEEYDELYKDVNVSKFLNLDNAPPVIDEVASMMNVKTSHEELCTQATPNNSVPVMAIPKISTVYVTIVTLIIQPFSSILQMTTTTPVPTTEPTTSLSTTNESFENVVLSKSSSQPQSTFEAAASLTEFELKKILLDKLEKSKSYQAAEQHRDLYDALRGREDKDKDDDPLAGLDQGLKKRKTSKDAEPSRGSKLKESKSSSSKGSKSQSKSSSKSAQAEEPVFETADTEKPQDQGDDMGITNDPPNVEEASKHDWLKKPEKPPTPDRDWNYGQQIDFRPPQTWISKMAKTRKPPTTFDEMMSTPHRLLSIWTCKSRVELDFHFEECYKAVADKLDRHNPKGHEYPFDLSKPLPLIEDQVRQVVPANYFFNNELVET